MAAKQRCTPLPNGVQLGGWRFESESGRILNTRECKSLTERLEVLTVAEALPTAGVPPLPSAIFGHSYLTLTHEASGRVIHFDADGAITCWVRASAEKGSGGLKVTTASLPSWKQVADEQATGDSTDYDWTYSTDYCGITSRSNRASPGASPSPNQTSGGSMQGCALCRDSPRSGGAECERVCRILHPGDETPSFVESAFRTKVEYEAWLEAWQRAQSSEAAPEPHAKATWWKEHKGSGFDMALLRRCDVPIVHYVDLPLYEDELDDSGSSVVRLRLRVMPSCFLVLLRHALRVDGVLVRHHDTRYFHKFGTPLVLRDRRLAEAPLAPLRGLQAHGNPEDAPPALCSALLCSASVPDERQAAEKLALVKPKRESIEELAL